MTDSEDSTDKANVENNCSENNEILISCMVFHFMPPDSVGDEIVLFSGPVKIPLDWGGFKALSLHRIFPKPKPQIQLRSCTNPELVKLLFPRDCSEVPSVPVELRQVVQNVAHRRADLPGELRLKERNYIHNHEEIIFS